MENLDRGEVRAELREFPVFAGFAKLLPRGAGALLHRYRNRLRRRAWDVDELAGESIVARFAIHGDRHGMAPDGWFDPWMFWWQLRQARLPTHIDLGAPAVVW